MEKKCHNTYEIMKEDFSPDNFTRLARWLGYVSVSSSFLVYLSDEPYERRKCGWLTGLSFCDVFYISDYATVVLTFFLFSRFGEQGVVLLLQNAS